MLALESRAAACGFRETWLDTATNQPEATAFYESLGYVEVGRESRPGWHWTLTYYVKRISPELTIRPFSTEMVDEYRSNHTG